MELSERIANIQPSATLAFSNRAKEMAAQGIDVLNLAVGQPDFKTPSYIGQAAIKAIEEHEADSYTAATGILPLRKAIANHINEQHGTDFGARDVVVTNGGKFALYAVTQALLNPGDEALIPLPYWVSYGEQIKLAGAKPVLAHPSQGLKVTVEDLEAVYTPQTKLLVLNTPNNPSGEVFTKDELTAIANWAVDHDLVILADDMYGDLVYNGTEFTSVLDLGEDVVNHTVLVNGFSKSYAMTGWRVGYAVAPSNVAAALGTYLGQVSGNMAAVSQYAALTALTDPRGKEEVERMRQAYEERLNTITSLINDLPGVSVTKGAGAFYLFPDVSEAVELTGFQSTDEFVNGVLEEAYVSIVPGKAFGLDGHVRPSYATDLATLQEAIKRIGDFIKRHQK